MPKPKGSPKTGGRKKGSTNWRTREAMEIMAAYGVSGIEALCKVVAHEPVKVTVWTNKETGEFVVAEVEPTYDQWLTAAKELAQYEAPKRKAKDHGVGDGGKVTMIIEG